MQPETSLPPTVVGRAASGLSHLALSGARELTDLVAEMHATISRAPWPFQRSVRPTAQDAPFPYRIVSGVFASLARLAGLIPQPTDSVREPDGWRRFVAILNGVMGDKLARWNNPLATELSLCDENGSPAPARALIREGRAGVVLFLHGLCYSDLDWHNPEHGRLVARLRETGHAVGWLRYNSGRAIFANGCELAQFLEREFATTDTKLVLVGHSMGGLLIRSALAQAAGFGHSWPQRLHQAAYLGSPHHGAPTERLGNLANAVLSITPYTVPLMRLGNVRSQGIKDLRYGCITPEDSAQMGDDRHSDPRLALPALPANTSHLLLAGSLDEQAAQGWLGDGMVPVASALGEHRDPALTLSAPDLTRRHVPGVGHIAMLRDARTYAALGEWLGLRPQ